MTLAATTAMNLQRLHHRLSELYAWRDAARLNFGAGTFTDAAGKESSITLGDAWPSRDFPVSLKFAVTVPQDWAGQPVRIHVEPGGEGILIVNGQAAGGLNPYHHEHPVLEQAKGGETLQIEIQASPKGLFGSPERSPHLKAARLVLPDPAVRAAYEDLYAVYDAAMYLVQAGREAIAQRLADALDAAFRLVPVPRGNSEAYLARAVQDPDIKGVIDGLWDEYDYSQDDAAPYPAEDRAQLQAAQDALNASVDALRADYPAEGTLALSGHAHIDLAWLWPLAETRRKARRTFATVLNMMDAYPDFIYNQSMAQLYAFVEQDDPELFERIKARVAEGRWDVVGGMWVEPDGNLISGESWLRQLLVGQRYFQSRFGKRATVCWLPDTFGYAANMPQFLRSGGIPYFFTTKLNWNETNAFPYDLYQWEGLDGSRVIAHSFANPGGGYNGDTKASAIGETWKAFKGKRWHDQSLLSFGHGDGGGGPMNRMVERYQRLKDFPGLPRLHMTRIGDFYDRVKPDSLPVWVGEQYLELHRGTYTTQALVKQNNRHLERALYEAEAACTIAAKQLGRAYPRTEINAAWEVLLRNQFHDILPGSGVKAINDDAHREMGEQLQLMEALRDQTLQALSDAVEGSGVVVWNLSLEDRPLRALVQAQAGELTGIQAETTEKGTLLIGSQTVPGLGYLSLSAGEAGAVSALTSDPLTLENEFLRVKINPDGSLDSLWDKTQNREALSGAGNQLWVYLDMPRSWEAWDVDQAYGADGAQLKASAAPRRLDGKVRQSVQVTYTFEESTITQTYVLDQGSSRLDIVTDADWHGRRHFLRSVNPLNVRASIATFETAYGAVTRTTHTNTSWDAAQFEKPGHRWADLSEGDSGVSVLTDSKYGYSANGNVLGLSLLRSPIYPDPTADEGQHHFTYSLYPHAGDWRNGTVAQAHDLNAPLRAYTSTQSGSWPVSARLLEKQGGAGLRLGALKLAEDSDDVIVRVYEAHGTRGELSLTGELAGGAWQRVNALEEQEADQAAGLTYAPYKVLAVKQS